MGRKKFKEEVAEDRVDAAALKAAQDAVADTTDGGDAAVEAQAVIDAQAALDANIAETIVEAETLPITDYNMVSNELARKILESKGKAVRFEEPEDVKSNHNMEPLN